MALNYCSSFGGHHLLIPEMVSAHQAEANFGKDLYFCKNCGNASLSLRDVYPLRDPICAETNTKFLPNIPQSDPLISVLCPETFPFDEFDYFQYPRHARGFTDFYSPEPQLNNPFDGSVLNPCMLPEFELSPTSEYRVEMPAKKSCLSAQSLAARQRRKKISEKSGELGKLIPRGIKMNTAEMFEAAFKYVKFLQTQVAILQLMGSVKRSRDPTNIERLHSLLSSSKIQEKLYEEEKCMVPKEFVEALAEDEQLLANPSISNHLHSLLQA